MSCFDVYPREEQQSLPCEWENIVKERLAEDGWKEVLK